MNEKKDKKRSKVSGTVVMIIFILAVIVGAYYGYEYFVLEPRSYDISDDGAVTTELYASDWADEDNVFDAMENNDGSFFYVKSENDESENVPMYKTGKEGFNEACVVPSEKSLGKAGRCMKTFFNLKGNNLPPDMEGRIDSKSTMFGNIYLYAEDNGELDIYNSFGTNIKNYFEEHQLCISCDTIKFSKVAVISTRGAIAFDNTNIGSEDYNDTSNSFYMIGSADVLTESAEGDLSSFGVFADPGETRTVNFKLSISTSDAWPDYSLDYFKCW